MKRDEVLAKIRLAAPELKRLGLGKLYPFGSLARHGDKPRGVDLLCEAEDEESLDFFDLVDAADRLESLLGRRVDLVDRKYLHRRIRPRVEADLIEIY